MGTGTGLVRVRVLNAWAYYTGMYMNRQNKLADRHFARCLLNKIPSVKDIAHLHTFFRQCRCCSVILSASRCVQGFCVARVAFQFAYFAQGGTWVPAWLIELLNNSLVSTTRTLERFITNDCTLFVPRIWNYTQSLPNLYSRLCTCVLAWRRLCQRCGLWQNYRTVSSHRGQALCSPSRQEHVPWCYS